MERERPMLKSRIKAGRVYLNGLGEERGPIWWDDNKGWICAATGECFAGNGWAYPLIAVSDPKNLVSRVKTPKADKPAKGKKWRKVWVVDDKIYRDESRAKHAAHANGSLVYRACIRIEPEE